MGQGRVTAPSELLSVGAGCRGCLAEPYTYRLWALLESQIAPLSRSSWQPVHRRKSSPRIQGSCAAATHTGWRTVFPPTQMDNNPFPLMGALSP